jgi:1-acyl-sn-glycerol-3-phosphate acyltransferase
MIADAWNPQIFAMGGKRGYILANQDATSIKGVRWLVQMMGCMPVPETLEENAAFKEAIAYRIKQKAGIVIYPERHIWPYYTHIRPFPDDSFVYPAELLAPVVAIAVTYRQRWLFKKCSPRMTMHISKPFYPDPKLSLADRKKQLRDDVYAFLLRHASEDENVEWIRYVKVDKSKERAD